MNIYCFAGPNGSGKSTIINQFIEENAIDTLPFINADIISKEFFSDIEDENKRNLMAAKFAEKKRHEMLENKKDFIFETVLSTPRNLEFLKLAKSTDPNINITTVYVVTNNSDINVERVKQRVLEGGHNVPEDKIRSRYDRCFKILPDVIEVSDTALIYDNSESKPSLIIHKGCNNKIYVYSSSKFVDEKILKPILATQQLDVVFNNGALDLLNESMFNLKTLSDLVK